MPSRTRTRWWRADLIAACIPWRIWIHCGSGKQSAWLARGLLIMFQTPKPDCLRDAGVADQHVSQTAVCDTRARAPSSSRRRVSYPVSDSMSCRRRARVPVPRRQTPAGAEDTSSRDSLVIVIRCAQRRPERQPRLHLDEDLKPVSPPDRSTKAGASTPATLARVRVCRLFTQEALNEGRSVNPGYTWIWKPEIPTSGNAQRRPERQPRRHRSTRLDRNSPSPPRNARHGERSCLR